MPPKYDPKYVKEGDWHVHKYILPTGDELRLQARDVRRERTGVHARVAITLNQILLASDHFNVERDKERVHLVGAALKRVDQREYKLEMPRADIEHGFDLFCDGLWEQSLRDLRGKLMAGDTSKPVVQLVRGLVLQGGGTMIYAPPGRGKTYTLLTLAVCLDAGLPVPGAFEVLRPAKTLFINLERSEQSMEYRLGKVNLALGLDEGRQLAFMNARGKSLRDIYPAAQDTMKVLGCEAVALDSLSRTGSGSLTDDEDANHAMDLLNNLAPTWVLAAHTPRTDATHAFGSQMFDAAVDVGCQLSSQQRNGSTGVGLTVTKENDLGPQPLRQVAFDFNEQGLYLIRAARKGEFPEVEGGKPMSLAEEITGLLLQVGPMSCPALARELGRERSVVAHVLRKYDQFTVVGRDAKEILYAMRTRREEPDGS